MSRSGYDFDAGDTDPLEIGRWRAQVASAIRGKRGQAFLRELIAALDAMASKRLIVNDLVRDGEFCALGAVGMRRRLDMASLDPDDFFKLSEVFGIAHQLVRELEWINDETGAGSPEERWTRVRRWAAEQIKETSNG